MKWFWLFITGLLIGIGGIVLDACIEYSQGGWLIFGVLMGTSIMFLALKGSDEDSEYKPAEFHSKEKGSYSEQRSP